MSNSTKKKRKTRQQLLAESTAVYSLEHEVAKLDIAHQSHGQQRQLTAMINNLCTLFEAIATVRETEVEVKQIARRASKTKISFTNDTRSVTDGDTGSSKRGSEPQLSGTRLSSPAPALKEARRKQAAAEAAVLPAELNVFSDKYETVAKLGMGGYAEVFLVKTKQNVEMAAKICRLNDCPNVRRFANELRALLIVKGHPSCVQLTDVSYAVDTNNCSIIMEVCHGGELMDLLMEYGAIPEQYCKGIFRQIVDGVEWLHRAGIVHRDLKPENVLIKDKFAGEYTTVNVKLSDFGIVSLGKSLTKRNKKEQMMSNCGTALYMAPEILSGNAYDHSVDLWSCGVILHIMISTSFPFDDDNFVKLCKMIIYDPIDFSHPAWGAISEGAKALMVALMCKQHYDRPSANEVLRDAWFKTEQ